MGVASRNQILTHCPVSHYLPNTTVAKCTWNSVHAELSAHRTECTWSWVHTGLSAHGAECTQDWVHTELGAHGTERTQSWVYTGLGVHEAECTQGWVHTKLSAYGAECTQGWVCTELSAHRLMWAGCCGQEFVNSVCSCLTTIPHSRQSPLSSLRQWWVQQEEICYLEPERGKWMTPSAHSKGLGTSASVSKEWGVLLGSH